MSRVALALSLVAVILAGYSLWGVKELAERMEVAAPRARGMSGEVGHLISEARRHCQRAQALIRQGRLASARQELDLAISKLERAEKEVGLPGRTAEGLRELLTEAKEGLERLRRKLRKEGG